MSFIFRILSFVGVAILIGIATSVVISVIMVGYAFILRSIRYAWEFAKKETIEFRFWIGKNKVK